MSGPVDSLAGGETSKSEVGLSSLKAPISVTMILGCCCQHANALIEPNSHISEFLADGGLLFPMPSVRLPWRWLLLPLMLIIRQFYKSEPASRSAHKQ